MFDEDQRNYLSVPSPSQFVEELFIQNLVAVLAPHGQEDVTTDEFMDNFALRRDALKYNILFIAKLDHHVASLPVDIPGLK